MKLSTRSRYGLRALCELAKHNDEKLLTVQAIALRVRVSKKYLDTIFAMLQNAGLVHARRGIRGGQELARKPSEINLWEVVEVLEGKLEIVPCVTQADQCDHANACASRKVWILVQNAIKKVLLNLTLQDLIQEETVSKIRPLLKANQGF